MTDETKVGKDVEFLKSRIGIFKIITFFLAFISLITLSASQFWAASGLGPLQASNFTFGFISVTQLISIGIYFFKLYNLPLVTRLPWRMMEVGYAVICTLLLFISMAICAWAADLHKIYKGRLEDNFIACAIFASVSMILFGVFAFLTFRSDEIRSEPSRSADVNV